MMCKLYVRMKKGWHYDVEMKGLMQKVAICCANYKSRWIREGIMMCKCKCGCK